MAFAVVLLCFCSMYVMTVFGADGGDAEATVWAYSTVWSLLPPVIAIVLALITKEVYSSLFVGIVVGALLNANFQPVAALDVMVNEGFIAKLADGWNAGILIFLVVLGAIVCLINKAGGSAAYGKWASKKINSAKSASIATFFLGILIFVDDYFNCLTVGSVMLPITDKNKVSRAKIAYLIDATAAPICMIAPISSWAAAVSGVAGDAGYDGFELFVSAIKYNYYSLLTIVFVFAITLIGVEFGPMKKHEDNAKKGDLYTTPDRPYANSVGMQISQKGKVADLVLPIVILIVCCVVGMAYTGGLFDGVGLQASFADCDASVGLSLGSIVALIVIMIYMLARRVLSFKECMDCLPEGFKAMVPAILILTFAWTLSSMTGLLGAAEFVSGIFEGSAASLMTFMPMVVFLVAIGLSFATGTSWGTFGILLPIVINIGGLNGELLIISVSACLAGAVCGDHCSPISDTTIMASTGAQCNHVNHVSTQLPYALSVAAVSLVCYIVAAFTGTWWIGLIVGAAVIVAGLFAIKFTRDKKKAA